ncbi:hypothetical protein Q1695_006613 [Nippostrongylus brasiliensis]|nr:hypothetical protein Q1695_006613 [Nippostrongylus brasiliensis]
MNLLTKAPTTPLSMIQKSCTEELGGPVLDAVYRATELFCAQGLIQTNGYPPVAVVDDPPLVIRNRSVSLTMDQMLAVSLSLTLFPIIGTQAALGTRKTVVAVTSDPSDGGGPSRFAHRDDKYGGQVTETSLSL